MNYIRAAFYFGNQKKLYSRIFILAILNLYSIILSFDNRKDNFWPNMVIILGIFQQTKFIKIGYHFKKYYFEIFADLPIMDVTKQKSTRIDFTI